MVESGRPSLAVTLATYWACPVESVSSESLDWSDSAFPEERHREPGRGQHIEVDMALLRKRKMVMETPIRRSTPERPDRAWGRLHSKPVTLIYSTPLVSSLRLQGKGLLNQKECGPKTSSTCHSYKSLKEFCQEWCDITNKELQWCH